MSNSGENTETPATSPFQDPDEKEIEQKMIKTIEQMPGNV